MFPADVDPKLIERFERNLSVMDELIGDALRFARGTSEVAQEIDLRGYLDEIVPAIDDAVHVQWRGIGPVRRTVAIGACGACCRTCWRMHDSTAPVCRRLSSIPRPQFRFT